MRVEDLSSFALRRVAVHEGMAIDAATWSDAHTYHDIAQRLHSRAVHGRGIVSGLRVTASDPASREVILHPGVALDDDGNAICVPQPVSPSLERTVAGTVCIALCFAERPEPGDGQGAPTHLGASFELLLAPPPLAPAAIEVARVEVADARAPVRDPADAWNPADGELDGRYRRELRPAVADMLTIGQLAPANGSAGGLHRQGLLNVVRELQATAPFTVRFVGDVRADRLAEQCDLLYISGAGELRLTSREGAYLRDLLRGGGVVYAEPCAEREAQLQESGRFAASFQRLMADLKRGLNEMRAGHPLLSARHVFGAPPPGISGAAPMQCNGAVVLNHGDYGCCWQGGTTKKPLERAAIRDAIEFAANVAWFAADRAGRMSQAAAPVPDAPPDPALARR